ncbi:hypothetical protein Tco_0558781 [Tanacetum coccineum]
MLGLPRGELTGLRRRAIYMRNILSAVLDKFDQCMERLVALLPVGGLDGVSMGFWHAKPRLGDMISHGLEWWRERRNRLSLLSSLEEMTQESIGDVIRTELRTYFIHKSDTLWFGWAWVFDLGVYVDIQLYIQNALEDCLQL